MPADTSRDGDTALPRGMLHGIPFETYRDALLAWRNAGDEEYAYARKFAFLPEGRERELGRELWLKHAEISDACYAEVVRLKPPPPPLAPPFCKCCPCLPLWACSWQALTLNASCVMITLSICAGATWFKSGEQMVRLSWSEWFGTRATSSSSKADEVKPLLVAAAGKPAVCSYSCVSPDCALHWQPPYRPSRPCERRMNDAKAKLGSQDSVGLAVGFLAR